MKILYKIAETTHDFELGKMLFNRYAASLDFDLCFQNFSEELDNIASQYHKPKGVLLLAYAGGTPAGCVGVRPLDAATAELKRMFVPEEFRGMQIGRELLKQSLHLAKNLGYKRVRLDTLPTMTRALKLYRDAGFYEIAPYCFNPLEGAIYMEKVF